MLCEKCKQNLATVHVERTVNNFKTEHNLCLRCAAEEGADASFESMIKDFMGSIIGSFGGIPFIGHLGQSPGGIHPPGPDRDAVALCGSCGLSYGAFREEGKIGCVTCFRAFRPQIEAILKSIQGSSEHLGKVPQKAPRELLLRREIEDLRRRQSEAIENEDFEAAAELRDKIREAERMTAEGGGEV